MFNFLDFSINQFYVFILVLVRVSGIFVFDPIYGNRNVPPTVKICLSIMLTLSIFPIARNGITIPEGYIPYVLMIIRELIIGLILGFAVSIIFAGVEIGGQLIGFSMGLSIANVIDPVYGNQVTVIANLKYILAILIFFSINGHYWILEGLCKSYGLSNATLYDSSRFINYLIIMIGNIFEVAVRISAPVLVSLLLVNVGLSVIARIIPQMNVFIVGFPLQIGVGLITMALSLFLVSHVLQNVFIHLKTDMYVLMKLFNV